MKTVLFALVFSSCALFSPESAPEPEGDISDPLNFMTIIQSTVDINFEPSAEYGTFFSQSFRFTDARENTWNRDEFIERLIDIETSHTPRVEWQGDSAEFFPKDGAEHELPVRKSTIFLPEDTLQEKILIYLTYGDSQRWKITRWESLEHDATKETSFFSPGY
ncbi:hypothetical protein [Chitinivibrio alkaliphilus]|uniref:Uncharacterized protein n=1 Tax=Chitinivibrio alkaliphilus ACht1 TaxID=1313304 RepID=U7DB13_9BACT|nr:hypothetical protein [Chitinivibrio alkaliphilus]ERP31595.1 hypothetical protein CALK_1458 [Chitinivibrio alkaliphilus ACht1]